MNINNHRSISIIPAFSKLFENILYEPINSISDQKILFCSKQFGFRSKRNTIISLVEIIEPTKQKSTDKFTCLLLDLRKAFDSSIHEILSAKLEKDGVKGVCLK